MNIYSNRATLRLIILKKNDMIIIMNMNIKASKKNFKKRKE